MVFRHTAQSESKRAETRNRILSEAKQLVAQGGFQGASVAMIASHSGIATGTIYRHFPSKAELVSELFKVAIEKELNAVVAAMDGKKNMAERLKFAIQTFATRALRKPRLSYAFMAEPVDILIEKERLNYRLAFTEAFRHLISEALTKNECPEQDPEVSAAAMVGMLSEVLVVSLSPQICKVSESNSNNLKITGQQQEVLVSHIVELALRAVGMLLNDK